LEAFCTFFPEVWSNEELRKTLLQKVKETVPREPAEVQKGLEKKLWVKQTKLKQVKTKQNTPQKKQTNKILGMDRNLKGECSTTNEKWEL